MVRHKYADLASIYDARWSFYIQSTLSETIKRLNLHASDRILDIGCGTAVLLQKILAEHPSVEVVGADLCLEMVKVAREKLEGQTPVFNAQAQYLPFRSESFDLVVSCNAFHYMSNPELCLSEISRVLKPQGKVVITDWCNDYIACRVCDFFLSTFTQSHFKTYGNKECGKMLRDAGFQDVVVDRYKINWLWGLMTAMAKK